MDFSLLSANFPWPWQSSLSYFEYNRWWLLKIWFYQWKHSKSVHSSNLCKMCLSCCSENIQKYITENIMVSLIAKDMLCYIKHWIYSWENGLSCFAEEKYKFSKDLLLYTVQNNKDVENALSRGGFQEGSLLAKCTCFSQQANYSTLAKSSYLLLW